METNERAPLLSDKEFFDLFDPLPYGATRKQYIAEGDYQAASKIINFYEAKITSDELMVVKTAERIPTRVGVTMSAKCSECGIKPIMFDFAFCPGCGAKIIDA